MEPGRDLDLRVGERLFGDSLVVPPPALSESIADAWAHIVPWLKVEWFIWIRENHSESFVHLRPRLEPLEVGQPRRPHRPDVEAVGRTVAHALCLAVLKLP
jgi:hypothetical protein